MITSPHNRRVVKAVRLKKRALREKDRRFLVEGVQGVREALASGAPVLEVFWDPGAGERVEPALEAARSAGVPAHPVSGEVMGRLTSTVTPQGIVAVARFVDRPLEELSPEARCIPVLVEVRDPGNAGTIVRSADAAGADAVLVTGSSVDLYNPKAVRSSAGSLFHLPVVRGIEAAEAVEFLRERGFAVLAADAAGERSVYEADLSGPTAVLFGNEAHGLSEGAAALADATVRVPIHGRAESLNLAAATALVLFESARQRLAGPSLAAVVAGAAHDIRSPLAAMLGFTSTMLRRWDRLDDEHRLAMVEGIAADATRMRLLVSELVDAARLASGTLRLGTEPVDVLEVARRVAAETSRSGTEVRAAGERWEAVADAERLHTVLSALVEGAAWWGREGPVLIEVGPGRAEVRRAGAPLEPDALAGLFVPRTPGTGGGSKIGLYVASGLASAMGARLTASGEEGVRFRLELPARSPTGADAVVKQATEARALS